MGLGPPVRGGMNEFPKNGGASFFHSVRLIAEEKSGETVDRSYLLVNLIMTVPHWLSADPVIKKCIHGLLYQFILTHYSFPWRGSTCYYLTKAPAIE